MSDPFCQKPLYEHLQSMIDLEKLKKTRPVTRPITVMQDPEYADTRIYKCDYCKDLQVIDSNSGIVPCPKCGHGLAEERLRKTCGLTGEMREYRLAGFKIHGAESKRALDAAKKAVKTPKGFLTYWGLWGTGKSYLLAAIVNECRANGIQAVYSTAANLLDDLRSTFDPASKESYSRRFERMRSCRVLALDEIDKFRASEWAEEKFFQLVDERYQKASECLTVFATNSEVKTGMNIIPNTRYPGYLESRLLDGRFSVVYVGDADVRPLLREKS